MRSISVKEFLFWKKKQLSKGGDYQSLKVLLDCIGGLNTSDINLISESLESNLYLKNNLDYLESILDDHLLFAYLKYFCLVHFLHIYFSLKGSYQKKHQQELEQIQ